ncbi:MAG: DUF1836 domain-containing protein [Velocimicrobium sp.]
MSIDNHDYVMEIIRSLQNIDYIKPSEIPNIALYMDQVTTFMDEHLNASKRYPEDKLLTKTMINNYTKNALLPPPNKKKYSKEHMLLLIFIYYFKNILSINDIQNLFHPLTEHFYNVSDGITLEEIYSQVFQMEKGQIDNLVKDVVRKYSKAKDSFPEAKNETDREFLQTFAFISMLSFDVYTKKMIIERLIDQSLSGIRHPETKDKTKDNTKDKTKDKPREKAKDKPKDKTKTKEK